MKIKKYGLPLLLFLILELMAGYFFYRVYDNKQNNYYQHSITDARHKFNSTEHTFSMLSNDFFNNHSQDIARIIAGYHASTAEQKDQIRRILLERYAGFHANQKLLGMEVFHIFDRQGNSLLRLHQFEKHSDPIYKLRYSLRAMRQDFTYQTGLEIGILKESFRYQFPLFYDGEFVGSYEYGIGFKALAREMKQIYDGDYLFLLKKQAIQIAVDQEVVDKRYKEFPLNGKYLYLKGTQNSFEFQDVSQLFCRKKRSSEELAKDSAFAIGCFRDDKAYTLIFIPVKDIEGQHIAFIVSSYNGNPDQEHLYDFLLDILLATLLFAGLMGLFYLIGSKRRYKYIKNILDAQKEMLALTDGQKIHDVNQSMLQFFGYEGLADFKQQHDCILDFFIEEEGYLCKSVIDSLNWVDYLHMHQDEKHKVKMTDSNGKILIFRLEYSKFKENGDAIITFHDITLEEMEYEQLEERASLDALTGIFNRERFNFFLEMELDRADRYQRFFSLIMFDIDNFKQVNDTYGHDVGDETLKSITSLVKSKIRETDIFCRWGGEEFMIITLTDLQSSEQFSEKLRKHIESCTFEYVGTITSSFGVTQYRKKDTTESLIKRCDNALYTAKHAGKNCVVTIR